MSITGIVENDMIKLPVHVPDGTRVEIIVAEEAASEAMPEFLRKVLAVAGPQDWPADYALNHAHYTKGEPRK